MTRFIYTYADHLGRKHDCDYIQSSQSSKLMNQSTFHLRMSRKTISQSKIYPSRKLANFCKSGQIMNISVVQESQSSDFSSTLNIRPYAKPHEEKGFFSFQLLSLSYM